MAVTVEKDKKQTSPDSIVIKNPVTGEIVGTVPICSEEEIIEAVQTARKAQPEWAAKSFRERAKIVRRFHDIILAKHDELFDILQSESGKSRRDAFVELFGVASEARHYVYHGAKYLRPRRVQPAIPLRDSAKIHYHPVGVVGIISPWNFPFMLATADLISALLAGNGIVLKPASLTPLAAFWMREKMLEAGLPPELLQIITGPGSKIGNTLIDHVDFVMFTGSVEVGRKVAERTAPRLIPYSMELGSKNAIIVLEDARIKHAVEVVIEGSFNNCGQACINYERLYILADIYDAFIEELLAQLQKIRLGVTDTFDTDIGSLIGEEQFTVVQEHVNDAVEKGAAIIIGGKPRPDLGPYFYEPTILGDVTAEMDVHSEETFGPVLSVYKINSAAEGIALANDTNYGLHFGVATRNRKKAQEIAKQLEAGTVVINDSYTSWAAMEAPMGGFKDSGVGRRHGSEGILRFTEAQTVFTNNLGWQIGSGETALAINDWFADLLIFALKIWRYIPFLR